MIECRNNIQLNGVYVESSMLKASLELHRFAVSFTEDFVFPHDAATADDGAFGPGL